MRCGRYAPCKGGIMKYSIKKSLLVACFVVVSLVAGAAFASAENWVEYERYSDRARVGPLHYKVVPAHYEKDGDEDVFVPADYTVIMPLYDARTETHYVYIEKSDVIYLRLNKRPSIEVAYDVVTYRDRDSGKLRVEFENVEVLIN